MQLATYDNNTCAELHLRYLRGSGGLFLQPVDLLGCTPTIGPIANRAVKRSRGVLRSVNGYYSCSHATKGG
jgi:hypothetical protein